MGKVTILTPVFLGNGLFGRFALRNKRPVCYYKSSSSTRWTKVNVGEQFEVSSTKTTQIKCVVPINDLINYAPFTVTKVFKGEDESVTPVFNPVKAFKVVLKDGNVPVRLCNFYRNGKAITRDYTDHGEDAARTWEDTFGIPKPNGFTWKGYKDGDYMIVWGNEASFQIVVSAYQCNYASLLVDLIPNEWKEATNELEVSVNLRPNDSTPFIDVVPVQSAQLDSLTRGKTYRCTWDVEGDELYVTPNGDAVAAFIETGTAKQYEGNGSTLKFECENITHIDPMQTMTAVGQIPNRAMHKFLLDEGKLAGKVVITNTDGVSRTVNIARELK